MRLQHRYALTVGTKSNKKIKRSHYISAEELEEAEASMVARQKSGKSTGDIIINLDLEGEKTQKSKKYLDPTEFGIETIKADCGASYMAKVDIGGDFLKQHTLKNAMSSHVKAKKGGGQKEGDCG